jgi:WhiB family redox-sensing transcriptional regulator
MGGPVTIWARRPHFIDHADQPPACRGHDPDLWFPEPGQRHRRQQAKAICATCPHQDPCRDWAAAQPRIVGIWGGTTYGRSTAAT